MSRRPGWLRIGLLAGSIAAAAVAAVGLTRQEQFPHARHAGLFPVCTGCHQGVPAGDSAAFYPSADVCAGCHDGRHERRVTYRPPQPGPRGLLSFDHAKHAQENGDTLACERCHSAAGAARMAVEGAVVERCLACHEHSAPDHLVAADCARCHRSFAASGLPPATALTLPTPSPHEGSHFIERVHGEVARANPARCAVCHVRERCTACHVSPEATPLLARIPAAPATGVVLPAAAARYPEPASHRTPDWLSAHGTAASARPADCATCHTRQSCETCHAGPAPKAVAAQPDARTVAAPGVVLPASAARYPEPASHRASDWSSAHGAAASARPADCSTCHTRQSCETCHRGPAPTAVGAQPDARRVAAPGVHLERTPPADHLAADWQTSHGAAASADMDRCAACHVRTDCTSCHEAAARPGFHPRDFVSKHATEAYSRRLDCASCHSTEAFCRDCHRQAGVTVAGRMGPGFHDAEPLWLLRHGQAARQSLETCATCHRQKDCLQCHSQLGEFRVNPHGPDFDPRRAQSRNARVCFACHLANPLEESP